MEANTGDIRRLSQAVTALTTAAARGMSRAFDVHRVGVLGLVVTRGEVTPSQAAAELDLPASSVTRHVHALEDAGQVTAVRNPHDARSCLIRPTAAGTAELRTIQEAGLEVFRGVVGDWTAEEVRTMAALTERLTAAWAAHGAAQQARVRRTRPVSRWQHDPLPTDGEAPA